MLCVFEVETSLQGLLVRTDKLQGVLKVRTSWWHGRLGLRTRLLGVFEVQTSLQGLLVRYGKLARCSRRKDKLVAWLARIADKRAWRVEV